MAVVILDHSDIALFFDPIDSRVVFPRLQAAPVATRYQATAVLFAGDRHPTPFSGEGEARSYSLRTRFFRAEHQVMADLLALFDTAHRSSDRRLLFRRNFTLLAVLNEIEVVTVNEPAVTPLGAGIFDVAFTAETVEYSIEAP